MEYLTTIYTDTGQRMQVNQDSLLLETAVTDYGQVLLGVVCDGMGGLKKGETASAVLARAFSKWFHREFPLLLYSGMKAEQLKKSWQELILLENQRLLAYGSAQKLCMGTTVTALLLVEGTYYISHVGDTRVYYLEQEMKQITKDQTFVQREVEMGRMSAKAAGQHPKRNILLQCVGAKPYVEPAFYMGKYEKESLFLLCSDGFWHGMDSWEFSEKLKPISGITEEKLKKMAVSEAEGNKQRGEEDNISVTLIRVY